jgi:putative tricarboxylic transport membrane protein
MSDRLAGLFFIAFSISYGYTAQFYTQTLTDPLGPSAFPQLLAFPLAAFGVYLVLRPDPDPEWVRGGPLLKQLGTVVVLAGYAFLIDPLGFIAATFVCTLLLAVSLGARWLPATLSGVGSAIGFYLLFDKLLELPLPAGPLASVLGE